MNNKILKEVYTSNDILEIRAANIPKLNELIKNVELKQKELNDAVRELSLFDLEIKFYCSKD